MRAPAHNALIIFSKLSLTPTANAEDNSDCYSISDSDSKNLCLGTEKE